MKRRSFLKYLGIGAAAAPLIPLVARLPKASAIGPPPAAVTPGVSYDPTTKTVTLFRGRTWFVDAQAFPFNPSDGSLDNPFHTMQEAIDAATSSDYIIMAPGEYSWVDERGTYIASTGAR